MADPVDIQATHFPFFSLPPEIQLSILQYTDLVTPLSAVAWRENRGFRLSVPDENRRSPSRKPCGLACGPPYDQCHPSNHLNCTSRLRDPRTNWIHPTWNGVPVELPEEWSEFGKPDDGEPFCPCPHANDRRHLSRIWWGRCCRCQHYACQFMPSDVAGNTELEGHRVWQPPTSLLLVSRSFRDLCSIVFYSKNHFHLEVPGYFDQDDIPDGRYMQAAAPFFSRDIPTSAISALRTLRIDFGDYKAMERYNDYHVNWHLYRYYPPADDMSQADELLKTDPLFMEYAEALQRTCLRLDTLTLTHTIVNCHLFHFGLATEGSTWEDMGSKFATRFVRQVVASLYWPPLRNQPLSVLGGMGRGESQRLIAKLNFGSDGIDTMVYYVRRQFGHPVPLSALIYYLGIDTHPFWEWETGPHKVSDGEPAGPGEEDSTVVDEVFFRM